MRLTKSDILEQVKNRQLTPEEGLKLYRALREASLDDHPLQADWGAASELTTAPQSSPEPAARADVFAPPDIAVIGISGQIPGAQSLQQMWTILSEGRDVVGEVLASRWNQEETQASAGESRTKWGAFLSDIDCFDPLFFSISPKEAEQMDPQQRLLLQESWKAFEDAGYPAESLSETSCCVFIGCTQGDYLSETGNRDINPHSLTGRSISAIAARISYYLNLRGPSMTVNTACSSSLTAFVLACEKLANGSCEMGLVGGISIMSTHTAHTTMSEVGMISPEGKCRTFDQDAKGIVPGEAIGVVILKRLADALRDGDQIYGVIRGYGINHDGKTNGLTAPSGPAQTALLLDIYERFQIDPNTINYVEAHGTGTKLGDPIEVHALTDAFAKYKVPRHQCALGSIKTNIGHTLEAAGLIGLLKVLLCLQQQKLVPSLHFNKANEHIAFAESPFYVNTQLQDWPCVNGHARRAGVSSFGMSGTNAHVVVEEPPVRKSITFADELPYLIVLSAKTPEALAQRVEELEQWLDEHQHDTWFSLADVAYTLQVGRSHFAYREAIVARDIEELQARLLALKAQGVNTTEPASQLDTTVRRRAAEDLHSLAQESRDKRQGVHVFESLADSYKQGVLLDWDQLYPGDKPQRISLPSYPFAKERYWLSPEKPADPPVAFLTPNQVSHLHPVLHENTSRLSEQRYTSRFTGDEFFLADHRVERLGQTPQHVLPGVVYLEMARTALLAATGHQIDGGTTMQFTDIAWIQPIYVDQPSDVHLRVFEGADQQLHYEIYTKASNASENQTAAIVIHAQGRARILATYEAQSPVTLDIAALQQQMPHEVDDATCYQRIRSAGVQHGERLQGIRNIALGDGQVLASLSLPVAMRHQQAQYGLHPTLMDSAIQSAIGLGMASDASQEPMQPNLPFALEQLDILGECEEEMLAWLRYASGSASTDQVQKLDIDLCDRQGNVRVRMRGLSSRVFSEAEPAAIALPEPLSEPPAQALPLHALMPVWNAIPAAEHNQLVPDYECRLLLIGATQAQEQAIQKVYPQVQRLPISASDTVDQISKHLQATTFEHLVWVTPETAVPNSIGVAWQPDHRIIQAQSQGVLFLFRIIKALLAAGYGEQALEWTLLTFRTQEVATQDVTDPTHASIHGLVGSLAKEYPHWKIRLLDLDSGQDWPLQTLFTLSVEPEGKALAYRRRGNAHENQGAEWFRQALIRVHPLPPASNASSVYRDQGVYVVIGGAGGIGEVWSRFMLERYQANLIWIGRRDKDQAIQQKLDSLPDHARVTYISADARDVASLEKAYREIKNIYPKIHGVVHSAIVLNDQSLARMDEPGFVASLSTKVDVSVCLAHVFGQEPLDFVLFFSSIQSFARAPGQSNYAAGCTFKDAFALKLDRQWPYAFSQGTGLHKPLVKVMNWGYWGSIGIVNDADYRNRRKAAGDGSIEPHEGMDILSRFVDSPFSQLAPFKALTPEVVAEACGTEDMTAYEPHLPDILKRTQERFRILQPQLPHAQVEWRQLEEESQNVTLDALLLKLLDTTLKVLGLRDGRGLLPGYLQRWLQESLRQLNTTDIKQDGQGETLEQLWEAWEKAKTSWMQNPNLKPTIILVETCMRALPDILEGKVATTDVMFPNGSMELVEGIYRGNVVSDYFQQALADFLVTAIQERLSESAAAGEPAPRLRILEIGAGTGGTTATLLPRLEAFADVIEEYCYTDLSKAFLLHAQEHYVPGHAYLSTRIFDVEKPLAEQTGTEVGVAPNHYDFVIAANVLHATKNIRNTLRNAKAALRTHGILLLNELSNHTLLSHLTFGLLEGWWLYEDASLRIPGSPGLYPETWVDLLAEEGFTAVSLPVEPARSLGLQIITAQSDGVVRQTRPPLEAAVELPAAPAVNPIETPANSEPESARPMAFSESLLREKSTDYLKERVARSLKMSPRQIDASKPLEIYGIDSILVVQLTGDLRENFKNISNTLFFEVQTIDGLVEHLLETQKEVLIELVGLQPDKVIEQALPPRPEHQQIRPHQDRRPSRQVRPLPAISHATPVREQAELKVFDVAVVGLSGRYPQASNVNELWEQLKAGHNCITDIPADRWDWQAYFDPQKGKAGKMYSRWGGFLQDVDRFDALFFRISPREAEFMDPQERLFLQCTYEALQDAGYTPENFGSDRKTGVFVGVMNSSYQGKPLYYSIANRISYQFDFHGPSMAIDTACSSSLTALHVALESLYSGTSKRAIVGGVNLILDPTHFTTFTELGILASGPECKSFGAGADGFVAAEGVGAVILKPLAQAVQDRDNIYGVLKGSAINAGGKTNGYTVPNPNAQAELVCEALQRSGVSAAAINYVEAHGTGTALGDPIEIKALGNAFAKSLSGDATANRQTCAIGSIKSNIGHCESAAGIAGLTKVLLQLKHRQLVPSLHSETTNPAIDFTDTPFVVQQQLAQWQRPQLSINSEIKEAPRTAGLSSFGAGGANAHVIIEEYIPVEQDLGQALAPRMVPAQPIIIPLSAKNKDRLRITVARLLQQVRETPLDEGPQGFNLVNLSYTLQLGREAMETRLGLIVTSMQELEEKLDAFLELDEASDVTELEGIYQTHAKADREAIGVLRADEDIAVMIDSWLAKKKYSKLLELWVLGFDMDWNYLYDLNPQSRPYRISLPGYPFLKECYWFEEPVPKPKPNLNASEIVDHNPDPGITFVAQWKAQIEAAEQSQISLTHQCVLIVGGASSIHLEQLLADYHRDANVILVRLANETKSLSAKEWLCDIQDEAGFAKCLQNVGDIDCVYFLSLDVTAVDSMPLHHLVDSQESHEIQLLRLVKYLAQHNRNQSTIDTYVLTLSNYAIDGEAVRPQGAGLTGLAYAIAQGNHRFAVRNIDLSYQDLTQPGQQQQLLSAIVHEPASNQGEVIKIQAGTRYRQEFHPLSWSDNNLSPIRQGGVYLILGGSGTIGQVITRHLIRQYNARVIWLGRSAEDSAKVQEALNTCGGLSENLSYIQADITSLNAMQQAVAYIKTNHAAIHGAIYSALVFDAENSIANTTEMVFRQILDVKTKGSIHFYTALENERLDFLCYFSSGQAYSFSGAASHSAYACGITFSDALVQALRHRAAFPVGTINWGFWKSSLLPNTSAQNFACLEDKEGYTCFEKFIFELQQQEQFSQALCFRPSELVLSLMNYQQQATPGFVATVVEQFATDDYIRALVTDSFANTLRASKEQIDPNQAFAEYGMDSILGVRFVNQLNERLRLHLNTAIIFEYASLARLSNYVIKNYRHDIEAWIRVGEDQNPPDKTVTPERQYQQPAPQVRRQATTASSATDIAVIGMSGKFPKAENVAAFWRNLIQGVDGIEEYPAHYLDQAHYFSHRKEPGKSYCKWGGILAERNCFDPQFFTLSPREAHSMNPHQRLVMQEGWKALEDAGYDPTRLSGSKTSIFIGAEPAGYFHETFTGSSDALIASRLSYHLNLSGPALVVNTACSASGVAIHLACESLRNGESDLALAGGVNACMNQEALINLSEADLLSPRGTCATFDVSADGTVISEGIGMVVLKRLQDAIADGDTIDGVICASGINQDGASNGITAPNGVAQEQLISSVYQKFQINPADITYVEAHGTGTKLGDPVEANALVRAFQSYTQDQAYCAVGSAKSHIGHTSAAAGIIGLIKVLLSMRHRKLPQLLHFNTLNPLIEFQDSPFYINAEVAEWKSRNGAPRMAALNSFGHSGTNAHLVIREYQPAMPVHREIETDGNIRLIPLSAKTESGLHTMLQEHVTFLTRMDDNTTEQNITLDEIAYTRQTGRQAMRHRIMVAARTIAELTQKMTSVLNGEQTVAGCWQGVAQADHAREHLPPGFDDRQMEALAQRWCQGYTVDWEAGYVGQQIRRVHLPTYPFAKTAYGPQQNRSPAQSTQPVQRLQDELRMQLYARQSELQNPRMEALLFDLFWSSLHATGILTPVTGNGTEGELAVRSITSLAEQLPQSGNKLLGVYLRWLEESIQTLINGQYLCRREGKLFALYKEVIDLEILWATWDQEKPQWLQNPNQRAYVNLVEASLRGLPSVLAGQKLATDIIFPNGSMELIEGIYQNNLISDYFNAVLGDTLISSVNRRLQENPEAGIRILEIGAGTGGTTKCLLQQLQPFRETIVEYCYTDLSKAFLNHAKRHYAPGTPYLSTKILDIDQPLSAQDVPVNHFDFVIATNVLHATGNIRRTLRHARSALRPEGLLMINEMSDKSLFVHLAFGLLEGWWLYEDAELRIPGIPGLYPESWSRVLAEVGFASVIFPAEAEHALGQQIIIAQNSRESGMQTPTPVVVHREQIPGPSEATALFIEDFVTEVLTHQLADALQMEIEHIARDESFADYGLDSLLGIDFIRTVNRRLELDLETVVIFDYNSVLKLSAHIVNTYRDSLISLMPLTNRIGKTQPTGLAHDNEGNGEGLRALEAHPLQAAGQAGTAIQRPATAITDSTTFSQEPIAIVGMSGRFAQSANLDELWKNLAAGKDQVRKAFRWELSECFPQRLLDNPDFCADGGFMDRIDQFDPLFFKISGAEATYMDPQQRLFLEAAWSALEDAGYAVDSADEKPYGVFFGYGGSDYPQLFDIHAAPAQAFWGNTASIIPARIAYYLNIKGPAVTVDTACSGSLIAIHQACQTLWTREVDLALAGAVSLMCTPTFYQTGTHAGMLSPTGRCHAFDERANGFVPGEGVGAVALKRLSDAMADGDYIHGVIRGTGMNQDGSTNGITAPSAKSQERLERDVYERFRIHPDSIQMVEAHGTGTKLGDPIEVRALTRSFCAYTDRESYCALGSVKTNIGHVGAAAGLAGLFKIVLAMKHKKIPASLHFQRGNPEIRFEGSPFYVNTQLQDWKVDKNQPRRAAISSFGFSGTNAHMVIEEAPASRRQYHERPAWLIVLSARSSEQLVQQVENLLARCDQADEQGESVDLGNLSYTLLMKRKHWNHRLSCVSSSTDHLRSMLGKWLKTKRVPQVHVAELSEERVREHASLKRYGNECIEKCQESQDAHDYTERLDTVADLYIQGYVLDFHCLFAEGHQTLSLPTYPFARDTYWVEHVSASGQQRAVTKHPDINDARQVSAEPPAEHKNAFALNKNWLFVKEEWVDNPISNALDWKAQLHQYAGKVIWAVYSDEQHRLPFAQLLSQLQTVAELAVPLNVHLIHAQDIAINMLPPIPDVVLFLGPSINLEPLHQPVANDIAAVYHLSQFLMLKAWEEPIQLYYLYESTSAVPRLDCESLSGLVGTAMIENPNHIWTLIGCYDMTLEVTGLQLLVQEWLADGLDAIARQQARWESTQGARIFRSQATPRVRYEQSRRQVNHRIQTAFHPVSESAFQARKTYLLVGGLGLIGEELCTELAKHYQANLIILSRREYNEQRKKQCEKLMSLGTEVQYYSVDVTNRSALQQTYAEIKEKVSQIHGVIHLGNTVEGGLIANQDWETFQQMGEIKTKATLYLDEVTADEPLEFFMLFSSIAAFGIRGSASYSYACSFLNQFSRYRNRLKDEGKRAGHTISLCWGSWTSDLIHTSQDKERRQKIHADGFDLIPIEAAFPLIGRCPAQPQDMLGIWAIQDVTKVSKGMDVELKQLPETQSDAVDIAVDVKGCDWEAKISAWEQQAQQGGPASLEAIAAEIDLEAVRQLEPVLIQRIYQVLFQEQNPPALSERVETVPASPTAVARPPEDHSDAAEMAREDKLSSLKLVIKEVACELLEVQDMDDHETFQNYGMDSVFGVQLANRLYKKLRQEIPPKWLMDFPSIQRLAEHILEQ